MAIYLRRIRNKASGQDILEAVKTTPIKSKYTYFPVKHYTSWCMIEAESGISCSIGFKKTKKEIMTSFDVSGTDNIIDRIRDVYVKECVKMETLKQNTAKELGCSIEELGDVLWQKQLAEKNGQTE